MADIVLDKSYLDAATPSQIHSLCANHRVLMPEVLFYELTTTRKTSRERCFNKIPDTNNPVEIIPFVGSLLKYELNTHTACTPLYDRKEDIVFAFNRKLRTGEYQFSETDLDARNKRKREVEQRTKEFFEHAMMVAAFFPEINGIQYADLPQAIHNAKAKITKDISFIQQLYGSLLEPGIINNPVNPDTIDPDWAYFRWIQVRCLYSLDLIFRYNGHLPKNPTEKFWAKIEHDLLDSEYLITASLSGALACNEKRMLQLFQMLRPSKGFWVTC